MAGPSTRSAGNAIIDRTWYDAAGNVIKQQSGGSQQFTKTVSDTLGRSIKSYVGYDTAETSYADAASVSGDTIFEQTETMFDAAGNVIQTTQRSRLHDATGTGELTSIGGSQPKARVMFSANYPDAIGRLIAQASYGDNGGSTFIRSSTIPTRSDTVLVTPTEYNDDGEAYKQIDPSGKEDRTVFDDAGRVLKAIENYDDGDPTRGAADQDRTVTCYDSATLGSGTVVNKIVREFNDMGMIVKEYQEHGGAKSGSTLYVGINYDTSASSGEFTKGLRQTSVRYPNGRLVHQTYGSSGSADDNLNRLQAIKDDSSGSPGASLAEYTYLGLGQVVIQDLPQPDVKLDYFGGTSGAYAGFDRFGRVNDQRWYSYGTSQDVDRIKYGHDRASNRIWRENLVSKSLFTPIYQDEFYTYDGLHRRIHATSSTVTRHFYHTTNWQTIEERLGTSSLTDRQYLWGPLYIDHLPCRDRDTSSTPDGTLDERLYSLQGANWNVTSIVDSSGTVRVWHTVG